VIESPGQLFERVARAVSEAELLHGTAANARLWEERFHTILRALDFLPNSPTLMNAGTSVGQLSACFVLPIDDTMESIFGTLRDVALIQRTGGGTGFDFSRLRPAGDRLASTGGTASGPLSFMQIYDCATENIKLGGRRRGANMAVLRVDHPDIIDIINAKRDGTVLHNFNISIGVTDEFMRAVDGGGVVSLRHPVNGRDVGHLVARDLFTAICDAAWASGDPGLLFLDTIARGNPVPAAGRIESTNPCGEVPLLPYEACTLGSINVSHLVQERAGQPQIDWERLRTLVHDAVRFLDDVVSVNRYPLEVIGQVTQTNRKIGLGVMGFADLLIRLGISYADPEALRVAEDLIFCIAQEARTASAELAAARGTFPNWSASVYARDGHTLRNATQVSIAPTGTIGIIADTSSGIEPLFALAYRRQRVLDGEVLPEFNPIVRQVLERSGIATDEVLDAVGRRGGLAGVPAVPEDLRRLLVTALEIPPEHHVRMQAAFQRHVDNAVSKTVNLAHDATPADIAAVYRLAFHLGCKGITVYRYGSKETQVLEIGRDDEPYEREHFAVCDPGACRL
jgi:ribonucleoside-diphosphate reductase alpha chain